jgi:Domain of unknown function (DUF3846)
MTARDRTALIVTPAGDATLTQLPGDATARFAAITRAVGGYVELRRAGDAWCYLNEDGKQDGLPPNPRATLLLRRLGFPFRPGDFTVGTAVFLGPQDGDVTSGMLRAARQAGLTLRETAETEPTP